MISFEDAQTCFGGILLGLTPEHEYSVKIIKIVNKILNFEQINQSDRDLIDYSSSVPLICLYESNDRNIIRIAFETNNINLVKFLAKFWQLEYHWCMEDVALNHGSFECFNYLIDQCGNNYIDNVLSYPINFKIPKRAFKKFITKYPQFGDYEHFYNDIAELNKQDIYELGLKFNESCLLNAAYTLEHIKNVTKYCKVFDIHNRKEIINLILENMNVVTLLIMIDYPELCEVVYKGIARMIILEKIYTDYRYHIGQTNRIKFNEILFQLPYKNKEIVTEFIIYSVSRGNQFTDFPPLDGVSEMYHRLIN
jgi:hypothetical protein